MPKRAKVAATRTGGRKVEPQSWGRLEWMVSAEVGNSSNLTVGACYIDVGEQNPPHYHPNSDEVLIVVKGRILNRVDDEYEELARGDAISIPVGAVHNARNIGEEQAVLTIIYNTPSRIVVGE